MITTDLMHAQAVGALVQSLPTPVRLRPVAYVGERMLIDGRLATGPDTDGTFPEQVGQAIVARFVGSTSADLALVLADPNSLDAAAGPQTGLVSRADVVRPALESAATVFGVGVLGDSTIEDAAALFADAETTVYELTDGIAVSGWFALRMRANGSSNGVSRASADLSGGKIGRINNVEMTMTVEIGRTKMAVRDVLSLEPGAVIELDRSAGAPADVLLNGRLIAHGEIVVVDQDYAVRITRILDIHEGA
ncbi:flagellar motor switch protein FliN [Cryobacterium sp. Hh7]|uniref:flagellar motor switch protein FliN n=1 Tax=Cryobacterium sp. Hh7 TaxID=1259159 RepID=UPI00141B4196|nr:flagellar motor switch protein FliN [Cryobacterium sp. Hh7]